MNEIAQSFSFTDAGRRFDCRVDSSRPGARDTWWWFAVSTEPHGRHAPFRADASDTFDAIRARVVAYYDDLLARRAAPSQSRWGSRGRTDANAGAGATASATAGAATGVADADPGPSTDGATGAAS